MLEETLIPPTEILEIALGQRVRRIAPLRLAGGGRHSAVFDVATEAGSYVLRVPRGRQGFYTAYLPARADLDDWFDCRWALAAARRLGLPVPELVCSHLQPPRFVILSRLPGVPIADYETWDGCPYDEAEFGTILARLHAATPSGYGPIDDAGRTYFPTWPAFLMRVADQVLTTCLLRGSIDATLHARLRRSWYPALAGLGLARPCLLHLESLGFANILHDPTTRTITGLLDYEDCIGGDPLFELTWMEYYFGGRGSAQRYFDFARFEQGYGTWPERPAREALYQAFPLLEKLAWLDPAAERACEHRERLAKLNAAHP